MAAAGRELHNDGVSSGASIPMLAHPLFPLAVVAPTRAARPEAAEDSDEGDGGV
jgi:hypothetical protein